MKISVLIPAYNCAATIQLTLDSVFAQTVQADEILVLNDGSTDETLKILVSNKPRVTVLSQENTGLGGARDALCSAAQGDLIAFLDSDDLWHPRYLEAQRRLRDEYPDAVAYFTKHHEFTGEGDFRWESDPLRERTVVEVMQPAEFIERYAKWGRLCLCSKLCVPSHILSSLGAQPFKLRLCEDVYFLHRLIRLGPAVYLPTAIVAYRIRDGSLSSNLLGLAQAGLSALELLGQRFETLSEASIRRAFSFSLRARRRWLIRILLGLGETNLARKQLLRGIRYESLGSKARYLRLLILSYLPSSLQPKWPSARREGRIP